MSAYRKLKQQIAALEKRAAIAMREEVKKVIETIKKQITEFGLTAADLGLEIATRAGAGTTKGKQLVLMPKYREPTTGKTWNGHGKRPAWIVAAQKEGKLDELSIEKRALAESAQQAKAPVKPAGKMTQKKAAPFAKPAAKKATKKPTAPAPKKGAAAPKATAKKPAARKVATPAMKPPPAAAPTSPATTEPPVVAS